MLQEKYRPQHWRDLILPTQGKTALQIALLRKRIESGDETPLLVWLEGATGCGKSSTANVIANALGSAKGGIGRQEFNGSYFDHRTVKALSDSLCRWLFGWRVIIINEVQEATKGAASAMLDLLESLPPKHCVIFTTMQSDKVLFEDQTDKALKARCHVVEFTTQGIKESLAPKALELAKAEGLDFGADEKRVRTLIENSKNSIREVFARIGRGELANVKEAYTDAMAILAA
jgi:DNA polymerase III delta prime subunit